MVCKIFFAPNSPIFRKSCNKEEEGEKATVKRHAFQANAIKALNINKACEHDDIFIRMIKFRDQSIVKNHFVLTIAEHIT